MSDPLETRVALVGAGPVGLEVAARLAQRGIECLHFERGEIADTIAWFPPGMRFLSPSVLLSIGDAPLETADRAPTREEYLAYLRSVPRRLGLDVRTGHDVVDVKPASGGFALRVRGPDGELDVRSRQVVLAIGELAFPRLLGIPGEDLPHVSHYFEGTDGLAGLRVVIVGGGMSALEAAEACAEAGAKVLLSYRGADFRRYGGPRRRDHRRGTARRQEAIRELSRQGRLELCFSTTPTAIEPDVVRLRREDDHDASIAADRVYLLTGHEPDLSLLAAAGGNPERPVADWRTLESDVPGLYLAGTVTSRSYAKRRFIHDARDHSRRIVAHLLGEPAPPLARPYWRRPRRRRGPVAHWSRRIRKRLRRGLVRTRRAIRRGARVLKARLRGHR